VTSIDFDPADGQCDRRLPSGQRQVGATRRRRGSVGDIFPKDRDKFWECARRGALKTYTEKPRAIVSCAGSLDIATANGRARHEESTDPSGMKIQEDHDRVQDSRSAMDRGGSVSGSDCVCFLDVPPKQRPAKGRGRSRSSWLDSSRACSANGDDRRVASRVRAETDSVGTRA